MSRQGDMAALSYRASSEAALARYPATYQGKVQRHQAGQLLRVLADRGGARISLRRGNPSKPPREKRIK
jgi:hypothetical protein